MDALVAYGSGSDQSDNDEQQQKQKQSSHEEEGNSREKPVLETSTITTMDLQPSSRVPLPLELNCEIFKCLKLPIQRKFIWGLGRDIYGIFGQKLLKKIKRVRNPLGNRWKATNTSPFPTNGLHLNMRNKVGCPTVFAERPFLISGPQCRVNGFPGTILYYYEVKSKLCTVGLSDVAIAVPDNLRIGYYPNSYAFRHLHECWLAGERHPFELPEGALRPRWKPNVNIYGCGLVLDPEDNLAIFFTLNGILIGRKFSISPTVDRLFPAVTMTRDWYYIKANFGNNKAKPFEYDIQKCPGLGLACI